MFVRLKKTLKKIGTSLLVIALVIFLQLQAFNAYNKQPVPQTRHQFFESVRSTRHQFYESVRSTLVVHKANITKLEISSPPEPPKNRSHCSLFNVTRGPRQLDLQAYDWSELAAKHPYVSKGGLLQPPDCVPQHNVAIVISFRNREAQLKIFLNNVLPLLRKQKVQAWIVVVEQLAPDVFNKGVLYNIGFLESLKLQPKPDCFIFHDVDLIPENDQLDYFCKDKPAHMSEYNKVEDKYKKSYHGHFGGVVAISKDRFIKANGYPTVYWGWGGEDDEMSYRIGKSVIRPKTDIGRFTMLRHNWTLGWGGVNDKKHFWFYSKHLRKNRDGLRYTTLPAVHVKSVEAKPLYTHISVEINEDIIWKILRYNKKTGILQGYTYVPKKKPGAQ